MTSCHTDSSGAGLLLHPFPSTHVLGYSLSPLRGLLASRNDSQRLRANAPGIRGTLKLQIPNKSQIPISKSETRTLF